MTEKEQFYAVAKLSMAVLICICAMGALIIFENVTQANSFGIDGIVGTLKDALLMLLGALVAMIRQHLSSSTSVEVTKDGTATAGATGTTKE